MRPGKLMKWANMAGTVAATALTAAALDCRLATTSYAVESSKVTAPVRLAQISDLHSCFYGYGQRTLLQALQTSSPDAVLLTGDILDERRPLDNSMEVMRALGSTLPCYFVTGNHELRVGSVDEICQALADLGICVLRGTAALATLNGQSLVFCGVDDPDFGLLAEQLDSSPMLLAGGTSYSVLLAHRPEYIQKYQKRPFDLVVAGHAHGGQWRIPGLLGGVYAPGQGLFPQFTGGRYCSGEMTMIVSRGLARETTPVPRLFNRPELVIIDIVPEAVSPRACRMAGGKKTGTRDAGPEPEKKRER